MEFDNRKYVIIPATAIDQVDFSEVLETSAETCRYNVDGTETFVKYDGDMPESVASVTDRSAGYTHAEILEILSSNEWTADEEMV